MATVRHNVARPAARTDETAVIVDDAPPAGPPLPGGGPPPDRDLWPWLLVLLGLVLAGLAVAYLATRSDKRSSKSATETTASANTAAPAPAPTATPRLVGIARRPRFRSSSSSGWPARPAVCSRRAAKRGRCQEPVAGSHAFEKLHGETRCLEGTEAGADPGCRRAGRGRVGQHCEGAGPGARRRRGAKRPAFGPGRCRSIRSPAQVPQPGQAYG